MAGDTFPNTAWLEEFFNNLVAFMDDLRGNKSYHIGVSQYSVVQDLLLACITQGELPDEQTFIRQFKEHIRPVLCTSAQEQTEFYQRYDAWFPIAQKAPEGVEEQVDLQAAQVETNLRRLPWLRWAALVMATVVLMLLGQQYVSSQTPPQPPIAVPTIVTPIPTTSATTPTTPITHTTSSLPSHEAILGIGVSLIILVLLLVIIIIIKRQNRMVLARLATVENPQTVQISLDMDRKTILDSLQLLLVAKQMRQRVPKPSDELAVNRTIEASIEQGGWFTPVYKDRQVLPE
jgi:hypothetical protein